MHGKVLTLLLTFSGICLYAQTNMDSLYRVWQDQNEADSVRVTAFKQFIWKGFLYSQPDTALILAEELLVYGLTKNDLKAQAISYHTMGVSCYFRGAYRKALSYYNQSLQIQEKIGDPRGIADCLNNIGLIYVNQGDYPKALDYYNRSLKIDEQSGDQKGVAASLNNIGIIYNNQGDYPKALDYYNRSLEIKENINDLKGVAASLNNIGIVYEHQGDYPKALEYHKKSLRIKEEIDDQMGIAPSLHNIGSIYLLQNNFLKALEYYNQSLKIKQNIGDKIGIAQTLNKIGIVYQNQGDFAQALKYCLESYDLAVALGSLELKKSGCNCLYDTYKAMGNEVKALEYHELLNVIKDSLHIEETVKKLQQMEFQKAMFQDSIEKAKENRLIQEAHEAALRRKNRTKNFFLAGGIILIFISLGLWRGLLFVRKSRKMIALEKDKSDKLLLNILPEDIAKELKQTGASKPRKYEHVSILFTDFIDFTRNSEKMSPEELVAEINTCYKAFDRIIEKRGIEKIKTIGDAYMAVDGFGQEGGLAARNIVLAALEIVEFTEERIKQYKDSGHQVFKIRAGVHTGDVIAGIVGEKKFQFDIWGNAVNIASRMENHSEMGKVNLSQVTHEFIKNDPQFEFTSRGGITVKGVGQMDMWFVSRKK